MEERQRRNTLAELGRDVVLEDEEGTLYFHCKVPSTGKVASLSVTQTSVNIEMYKEGEGLRSESFKFEEIRTWEVLNPTRKKDKQQQEDDGKDLLLNFGSNRNPPTLVLRTLDAEKIASIIRSRIESIIAQKKEKGETVGDIRDNTKSKERLEAKSFSEEFRRELAAAYGGMFGNKSFKLATTIFGTAISVFIMFGVS